MTRYIWAGWLLVEELDVDGATLTASKQYTWGLDLARLFGSVRVPPASLEGVSGGTGVPPASLEGAGGVGGLLATRDLQETATTADDRSYIHFYDANGNTAQLVDAESTTLSIAATYEYTPYGTLHTSSGAYADQNPWRFSTKQLDVGADLYYYGYRYYHPRIGRWLNRDPIGEDGGLNVYGFTANNPIDRIDPDGRLWTWACCTLCAGSLAADLGGGAAGCLWGCLESKRTNYPLSECMYDCIMAYLTDRMDHTQAFNIYKSAVQASSCVCCGIRVVNKIKQRRIIECQAMYVAYKAACAVPGCKNSPPSTCIEALRRLGAASECYALRSRFWYRCNGLRREWKRDKGRHEELRKASTKAAQCGIAVIQLCGAGHPGNNVPIPWRWLQCQ